MYREVDGPYIAINEKLIEILGRRHNTWVISSTREWERIVSTRVQMIEGPNYYSFLSLKCVINEPCNCKGLNC